MMPGVRLLMSSFGVCVIVVVLLVLLALVLPTRVAETTIVVFLAVLSFRS